MRVIKDSEKDEIRELLNAVHDPEVPVLNVNDLGIIRDIQIEEDKLIVVITPTYSGCPAMGLIEDNIITCLNSNGYDNVEVKTVLSPAWTTDWLSESGKKKLEEYGIAPPEKGTEDKGVLFGEEKQIKCPHCKSRNTKLVSQFGSTACKALYKCSDCKEPFDYFKCF